MGLLSRFKRQSEPSSDAADAPDAVSAARTRARRRLIGAALLLGFGVVGFPLLFETQPRPVAVNIPIEIPRRDKAPPLALPPSGASAPASAALPAASLEAVAERAAPVAEADAAVATAPAAAAAALPAAPRASATASAPASAEAASAVNRRATADGGAAAKPRDDDGARAKALLEGKPAAVAADSARVVVQVGAYTDANKLREVRSRVEKLGMSTYTQVVEVNGSRHTRVRVGPFQSRAEADKAAARVRAAGLPAAILSL